MLEEEVLKLSGGGQCELKSQSALGARGNYAPSPFILRGGLCPAMGRVESGMIVKTRCYGLETWKHASGQ